MDYIAYIKPELLVLVIALYALGMVIKASEKVKDKYIPGVITFAGIVLCSLYIGAMEGFTLLGIYSGIVQGILVAAAAVYTNQLIKQSKK